MSLRLNLWSTPHTCRLRVSRFFRAELSPPATMLTCFRAPEVEKFCKTTFLLTMLFNPVRYILTKMSITIYRYFDISIISPPQTQHRQHMPKRFELQIHSISIFILLYLSGLRLTFNYESLYKQPPVLSSQMGILATSQSISYCIKHLLKKAQKPHHVQHQTSSTSPTLGVIPSLQPPIPFHFYNFQNPIVPLLDIKFKRFPNRLWWISMEGNWFHVRALNMEGGVPHLGYQVSKWDCCGISAHPVNEAPVRLTNPIKSLKANICDST